LRDHPLVLGNGGLKREVVSRQGRGGPLYVQAQEDETLVAVPTHSEDKIPANGPHATLNARHPSRELAYV